MFTPQLSIATATLNSQPPRPLSKRLCLFMSLWVSWEVVLSGPSLADLSVAGPASAGALAEAGRAGMALAGSPRSVPHDLQITQRHPPKSTQQIGLLPVVEMGSKKEG